MRKNIAQSLPIGSIYYKTDSFFLSLLRCLLITQHFLCITQKFSQELVNLEEENGEEKNISQDILKDTEEIKTK